MIINQLRTYNKDDTTSELYLNGKKLEGEVLEDVGRPQGVKIAEHTCIPEGAYRVVINRSPRFGKDMMLLHNWPDLSVRGDDIKFTGIRVHAGTNTTHTAGCPLYRDYVVLQAKVQKALDAGEDVHWIITRAVSP